MSTGDLAYIRKITSYANSDGTGTVRNQVKFTYDDLWRVSKSEQSHEGVVGGTTPNVQYAYDMSAVSSVFDDAARLEKVTYPDGRALFYDYGAAAGVNDQLHRVDRLRETSSTGTILATYYHNGVGRLIGLTYDQPQLILNYWLGTVNGDPYDGFDRFGRVKDQYWGGYGGTADVDRFKYDYDFASNRIYRDIDSAIYSTNNKDQAYTYDGLHRLLTSDEGTLSGSTISGTPGAEQDWIYDLLGNWQALVEKTGGTTTLSQGRSHNAVNEITAITASVGANWSDPVHDAAGNMTEGPIPGDEPDKHEYTYDAWNRLVNVTDATDVSAAESKIFLHAELAVALVAGVHRVAPTDGFDGRIQRRDDPLALLRAGRPTAHGDRLGALDGQPGAPGELFNRKTGFFQQHVNGFHGFLNRSTAHSVVD